MKQSKLLISLPESMKQQLDALRAEGYTVSGYVRAVLERELADTQTSRRPRKRRRAA